VGGRIRMVTTVTMNPCIDRMVTVDKFVYGGLNRIIDSRIDAAGKGNNVAVAFHQLGGTSFCTGINYTQGGQIITDFLDKVDVPHCFVDVEGEVRVNLKIFDLSKEVVTEVNEKGHPVSAEYLQKLLDKISIYAAKSEMMVFSGSIPQGVPVSIYKTLLGKAGKYNTKCILDAEGQLLLEGLQAKPYMIKPNLYELESALGMELTTHTEIVRAAREFVHRGVCIVGVSIGEDGAIIVDEKGAYYAPSIPVKVMGTAGAGDSMVAGFCLAVQEGVELSEVLRYGVAAATASVIREGTLLCTRSDFEDMLPRVEIRKIHA
jgi:1-phosphofructokinase